MMVDLPADTLARLAAFNAARIAATETFAAWRANPANVALRHADESALARVHSAAVALGIYLAVDVEDAGGLTNDAPPAPEAGRGNRVLVPGGRPTSSGSVATPQRYFPMPSCTIAFTPSAL